MTDIQKIIQICKRCAGSGEETIGWDKNGEPLPSPITCRKCGGTGTVSSNSLHEDLITLFNDMSNRLDDILEKVSE